MNELEIIKRMKRMQSQLDDAIFKEHQTEFDLENAKMALMDELGEMNHENKASWCWWKKTQKEVDRDTLLEELVDAWHFALSIDNHENKATIGDSKFYEFKALYGKRYPLSVCYANALVRPERILPIMSAITIQLNFTIDDVYQAYLKKNRVNYERLNSGY